MGNAQATRAERTREFLAQRTTGDDSSAAEARSTAGRQHAALLGGRGVRAHTTASVSSAWQPLGPSSVVSPLYGKLTGRVTSIALDANDTSGNTVYLGTTGGGVWKSTNAAGPLAGVSFAPLTDTLPVFSLSAGYSTVPSLSIGAVAVQPKANPVVLAGTGDPNDATDSLYGEGILRSTDGGLTWTLVNGSHDGTAGNHSFMGLATAGIAWSTASPSLVVAAISTSPQSAIVDAMNNASVPGIYYSTDAGVTWQMATLYDGAQIVQQPQPLGTGGVGNAATSVVWDAQRGRFFAAVRHHGYYSSADGATWTRLTVQPGLGLTTANCPVGANGQGSANCPIFRGVVTAQPATGDLYALTIDAYDRDQGLWQDLCNAGGLGGCASPVPLWGARLDNGAMEVGSGNTAIAQGDYNLSLAVMPSAGGTLLFAGTEDLYRCSLSAGSTSCALRNTTNSLNGCNAPAGVFPAQHAIAAVTLSAGPLVLLGNDGGLWRSLDGVAETGPPCSATDAQHFENLNASIGAGGSLAEVVGFAQDPANAGTLLAGLGELGSSGTTNASALAPWPQLAAGEGGFPQIDPNTPANWVLTIGAGVDLKECTLGALCATSDFVPPATIGGPQVGNDAALLDAPSLLDPLQTSDVLVGTCRVWRGPVAAGVAWSAGNALSAAFDGTAGACTDSSAMVRSLAAGGPVENHGSADSSVVYAGMAGLLDQGGSVAGHVFVTKSGGGVGASWTDAAKSPVANDLGDAHVFNPGAFDVSAVVTDPHDASGATVYAALMGFGVGPHLYRSTDSGAHWLTISSNLPFAPVNAIVVDPNDANTVYVALDAGVYVTQAVTSCPSANCWSALGTGLPNAPVTVLEAGAQLPTGDGRRGLLRAGTYGRGLWQIPLVTAQTTAQPAITLSATSLVFAAQAVATESGAQTITVTSSGNAPVTFGTPAITGDFVESDTCAGQTLAAGSTCSVTVRFAPTQTGTRTGLLTLYANVNGGQATVSLSGAGTAPAAVVLTPLNLSFAATIVNQTTAAQIITVANTGGNPATLSTPTITGDFAIAASTCGATLASQTACSLSITFTPTASGTRTGALTVTGSAGTQTAQLSGTGNAPATDTLGSLALTFAQQAIGTSSAAQTVTLTNNGDVALTLITAKVSAGDFAATNGCGASLNAHASCSISVVFVPTAVGTRNGTLTVTDQFRQQTVALTGTGIAPPGVSLSPASLSFAATGVGLTAPPQTVTLTNNGGLPLVLSNVAASGGFLIASSSCGASGSTLAPGAACSMTIVFAPNVAGDVAGTLTLTDNAPSPTQTVDLSGTAVDFTLAPDGPTSLTVTSGGTATYPLLLSSAAALSGPVAFACTGAPANAVCTVNPSPGVLGGTSVVTVTVQTGVATGASIAEWRGDHTPTALLALLAIPAGWWGRRKKSVARLMMSLLLTAVVGGVAGCGAARTIPLQGGGGGSGTGGSSPTPSGTYNLTVTGSAAGLSHSVGLTLIVK